MCSSSKVGQTTINHRIKWNAFSGILVWILQQFWKCNVTNQCYCTDLDLILMTVWQNFVNFKTFDAFKVVITHQACKVDIFFWKSYSTLSSLILQLNRIPKSHWISLDFQLSNFRDVFRQMTCIFNVHFSIQFWCYWL